MVVAISAYSYGLHVYILQVVSTIFALGRTVSINYSPYTCLHKLYILFRLKRMAMMVQNWAPKRLTVRRGSGQRRSFVRAPVSLASRWALIRWPHNRAWLHMANSARSTSHRSSNTSRIIKHTPITCEGWYSHCSSQYMAPVQLAYTCHW